MDRRARGRPQAAGLAALASGTRTPRTLLVGPARHRTLLTPDGLFHTMLASRSRPAAATVRGAPRSSSSLASTQVWPCDSTLVCHAPATDRATRRSDRRSRPPSGGPAPTRGKHPFVLRARGHVERTVTVVPADGRSGTDRILPSPGRPGTGGITACRAPPTPGSVRRRPGAASGPSRTPEHAVEVVLHRPVGATYVVVSSDCPSSEIAAVRSGAAGHRLSGRSRRPWCSRQVRRRSARTTPARRGPRRHVHPQRAALAGRDARTKSRKPVSVECQVVPVGQGDPHREPVVGRPRKSRGWSTPRIFDGARSAERPPWPSVR